MMKQAALWGDVFGGAASVTCAVHCMATPFLAALAPVLVGERVELGASVGLLALSGLIVGRGWWTHRHHAPVLVYLLGAGLLLGARLGGVVPHDWEHAVMALVAGVFVSAHAINATCSRRCCGTQDASGLPPLHPQPIEQTNQF